MIATRITALLGIEHPVLLAPMGGVSGGALAAAVSNAGGFGMVGGGYGDPRWLAQELAVAAREAKRPWGAGLITWSIAPGVLELVLEHRPAAVMLSFGDPRPHAPAIRAAGARLLCQAQTVEDARLAVEAGADVVVAQGTEAGGHGAQRAAFALVPAAVDAAAPVPVAAAGGIADGRGLAAALMLGAEGAVIGTRFYASRESLAHPAAKRRIVEAHGGQTLRTRVFDVVRGYDWPEPYTGRALSNRFVARWQGFEGELAASRAAERAAYQRAVADGDFDTAVVWAGEGVDLVRGVDAAGEITRRIAAEAETCLDRAAALRGHAAARLL